MTDRRSFLIALGGVVALPMLGSAEDSAPAPCADTLNLYAEFDNTGLAEPVLLTFLTQEQYDHIQTARLKIDGVIFMPISCKEGLLNLEDRTFQEIPNAFSFRSATYQIREIPKDVHRMPGRIHRVSRSMSSQRKSAPGSQLATG